MPARGRVPICLTFIVTAAGAWWQFQRAVLMQVYSCLGAPALLSVPTAWSRRAGVGPGWSHLSTAGTFLRSHAVPGCQEWASAQAPAALRCQLHCCSTHPQAPRLHAGQAGGASPLARLLVLVLMLMLLLADLVGEVLLACPAACMMCCWLASIFCKRPLCCASVLCSNNSSCCRELLAWLDSSTSIRTAVHRPAT